MQMFYKVTVQILGVGSVPAMTRSFHFASQHDADTFARLMEHRSGVTLVGTSIDHLMSAREASEEVHDEIDMAMRVAYSESL